MAKRIGRFTAVSGALPALEGGGIIGRERTEQNGNPGESGLLSNSIDHRPAWLEEPQLISAVSLTVTPAVRNLRQGNADKARYASLLATISHTTGTVYR